jgi:type IV fimbrial biogenesis protein FimT
MQVHKTTSKGFTLIELLICLSIAGILFMFILPFGESFLAKNKLSARTEEIVTALHFARSQAILLNQNLILTPINQQNWSSGMVLSVEQGNQTLYTWQWHDQDLTLTWAGMYDDYLLFTPRVLNSVLAGSFSVCSSLGNGKKIQMNRIGRIRVADDEERCHT